jgi:hypothetical protein
MPSNNEADEAFGGTVTRQRYRLMPALVNFGRGHRFAAYPRGVLRTIVGTRGGEPVSKVVGFGETSCCLSRPS